jgi:hypothetical protein
MATQGDVRRIALALPGAIEATDRFAFSVLAKGKPKGFAWAWNERVDPKKPRVPRRDVLAVRVRDQAEKALLLSGDPERFFTEPHYDGFPAVLVRLPRVTVAQLRKLLFEAWRCQAPREMRDADGGPPRAGRARTPGAKATRRRRIDSSRRRTE